MRYSSKQKIEILFTSWWSPKLQSHIFRFWPRACCTKAVLRMHLLLLVLLTYNITKNLVFLKIIPDFSQWVSWSPYHFPIFVQEREIVTSFQKFVRSFCTQVYLRKNMLLSELCMDDWNPIFWDNEFFTSIKENWLNNKIIEQKENKFFVTTGLPKPTRINIRFFWHLVSLNFLKKCDSIEFRS